MAQTAQKTAPGVEPQPSASRTQSGPAPAAQPRQSLVDQAIRSEIAYEMDRKFQAGLSGLFSGLSPLAMAQATMDWWGHLLVSPGKQLELWTRWYSGLSKIAVDSLSFRPLEAAAPADTRADPRFAGESWQRLPYRPMYRMHLLMEEMARASTENVRGLSPHHQEMVQAGWRMLFEAASPSNSPVLNPEVRGRIVETRGKCLLDGARNLVDDVRRNWKREKPAGCENFVVGETVATTPGKVIYRNELMELIQYSPTTETVHADPVLFVPAWIMKYYILDLSAKNSMVRWLVDQGHTVFMVSWKNPGPGTRNFGFEDYVNLGVRAAVDAVEKVVPGRKIHGTAYCIGGTLLSIVAAAMARDGDARLGSVTLFAAQTDFTEAGEIRLFIDESQVNALDSNMSRRGFLEGSQMGGAFTMLRSQDLVWSRMVKEYCLGERAPMIDLMAWNADATRMSQKMHSEYLDQLYVKNALVEGHFKVDGQPVALSDIDVPFFVVGTESDHIAPWTSVYKVHLFSGAPVTFCLTNGGHNSGIVNEPGRPRRRYRVATRDRGAKYVPPKSWMAKNAPREGSWWPEWQAWLASRSGDKVAPPAMGAPGGELTRLEDAPGTYVRESS